MNKRQFSKADEFIVHIDNLLGEFLKSGDREIQKEYPAKAHPQPELNEREKKHVIGLMRVNHVGEIAAQALYKAQALTAVDDELKKIMKQSADEEIDHLDWCEQRLNELDGHVSYLMPIWYLGSFGIGALAGVFGDKWNLGFIAETEHQVVRHLEKHLEELPEGDERSRAILEQMREDESHHAAEAETLGAKKLPEGIKRLMMLASKLMTKTAYHI